MYIFCAPVIGWRERRGMPGSPTHGSIVRLVFDISQGHGEATREQPRLAGVKYLPENVQIFMPIHKQKLFIGFIEFGCL